jgi:GNAT superfamily N-acetyltransferase
MQADTSRELHESSRSRESMVLQRFSRILSLGPCAGSPDTSEGRHPSCAAHRVGLLIARCAVADVRAAQAMERRGCSLMDTLVYYACDLRRVAIPPRDAVIAVRAVRSGDEPAVAAVAAEAFRGYVGHYHTDPRLDRAKCDEAYVYWARRSCLTPGVADAVLVAEADGVLVGFATLCRRTAGEGEGVLFGVKPAVQGKGVYRSLMIGAREWWVTAGATRMVVSTQLANLAVQKVWTRLGFEPRGGEHTFHKWFDVYG